MTNYNIGDFLIRVKNAASAGKKEFSTFATKESLAVAKTLEKLGFLTNVKKEKETINFSFVLKNKKPILTGLKLISKPGLRVYMSIANIEKKRGPAVYILTSSKGIISSLEARKLRVGGEVLAKVW